MRGKITRFGFRRSASGNPPLADVSGGACSQNVPMIVQGTPEGGHREPDAATAASASAAAPVAESAFARQEAWW